MAIIQQSSENVCASTQFVPGHKKDNHVMMKEKTMTVIFYLKIQI